MVALQIAEAIKIYDFAWLNYVYTEYLLIMINPA